MVVRRPRFLFIRGGYLGLCSKDEEKERILWPCKVPGFNSRSLNSQMTVIEDSFTLTPWIRYHSSSLCVIVTFISNKATGSFSFISLAEPSCSGASLHCYSTVPAFKPDSPIPTNKAISLSPRYSVEPILDLPVALCA